MNEFERNPEFSKVTTDRYHEAFQRFAPALTEEQTRKAVSNL